MEIRNSFIWQAVFVLKRDATRAEKFEKYLLDISNPSSANYGKWLSKEEVISMMAPESASVDAVMKFLSTYGISRQIIFET